MGRNRVKKFSLIFALLPITFLLSGCNTIFQEYEDPYLQKELNKSELEAEHYYVKDGTKFISLYQPENKSVYNSSAGQSQSIFLCTEDFQMIPTLYKGEILAYASKDTDKGNIKVTRYKELGYSIGAFGCEYKEGFINFDAVENVKKETSLFTFLEDKQSKKISLETLNGEAVTEEMLSPTGILTCLEKEKQYEISFYAGTYYGTGSVVADTFFLEEFEYFELSDINQTKNGYFSIVMPDEYPSGWYFIAGSGFFRYINEEKGADLQNIEMNIPFYDSGMAQDEVYSQRYSVNFDTKMKNVSIQMTYDISTVEDITAISGKAYAPDGTAYVMENQSNMLVCPLEEAMAGKWYIMIEPKELIVTKQEIVSNLKEQERKEEEFPIYIENDTNQFQFIVNYEGTGEINGIITSPDGTTYTMEQDSKNNQLQYTAAFLPAGIYQVRVFHYTDTNILGVDTFENTKTDSDIITITE